MLVAAAGVTGRRIHLPVKLEHAGAEGGLQVHRSAATSLAEVELVLLSLGLSMIAWEELHAWLGPVA